MLIFVDWRSRRECGEQQAAVLNTNRMILVFIYFWSGISKLNYASMVSGPRQLLSPLADSGFYSLLSLLWMAAPIVADPMGSSTPSGATATESARSTFGGASTAKAMTRVRPTSARVRSLR